MAEFSESSSAALGTCHEDLQKIMNEAIKVMDFKVLEGHRGKAAQDKAVREGKSRAPWPSSKHNRKPSIAVDIAPYPIDWKDTGRFQRLAGVVMGIAHMMGIAIKWGGEFSMLVDMPHFELIEGSKE